MTRTIFTDRSRIETAQHCMRERYLRYHQNGVGLESARKPLPLAVGGAVHRGLEVLLRGQMGIEWDGTDRLFLHDVEQAAVDAAVADLAQYKNALAVDPNEQAAMAAPTDLTQQMAATASELGVELDDPTLKALYDTQANGRSQFDEYLWKEQSALVEGLVRAYARRRLRPLLEEFEVLEVEREGTWELARQDGVGYVRFGTDYSIVFCSRPDALLRSRSDNSLYLMSFKTAASWDRRKELDAQHDMQGLSEGVEVERRLGEWWGMVVIALDPTDPSAKDAQDFCDKNMSVPMREYLRALASPPRILGIRYEYMLKGERWRDKELSARFGFEVRSQKSHLIRRYVARGTAAKGSAFNLGDECWSYDYIKEDGGATNLYYAHWKPEPVDDVKRWIDRLDASVESFTAYDSTTDFLCEGHEQRTEAKVRGWKSEAQALGYTTQHPLDAIFIPPITVYRNDDDLRDWLEQTEAQEVRVAEAVAEVNAATDQDDERSALNRHFPMTRRACSYPSECAFVKICYGGEDLRRDPLSSGKFVTRIPNHAAEVNRL
jgi:hypothetical protein